jgi:hypothetical protein
MLDAPSQDSFAIVAKRAGCSLRSSQPMPIAQTCWRCRAAACLSPTRLPARSERRSVVVSGRVPDAMPASFCRSFRASTRRAGSGPRTSSRLQDSRDRPVGDRRSQQCPHDREIEPGPDAGVPVCRRVHRPGLSLIRRHAGVHHAGNISGRFFGTLLWAIGEGLQLASVVALTVSFGLGLSATIHFLNRLRQEEPPDEDPALAVERATVLVGPPLDPDVRGACLRIGSNGPL